MNNPCSVDIRLPKKHLLKKLVLRMGVRQNILEKVCSHILALIGKESLIFFLDSVLPSSDQFLIKILFPSQRLFFYASD